MATTTRNQAQQLTLRQREGRAVNAVAELLRQRLSVPHIYIEPRSSLLQADVLAVDRAGSGDLHAVEIRLGIGFERAAEDATGWTLRVRRRKVRDIRDRLISLPVHFKYVALPERTWSTVVEDMGNLLYSSDGIGRLGVIAIIERGGESPLAQLMVTPERFRLDPAKLREIEKKVLERLRPDIEVRI